MLLFQEDRLNPATAEHNKKAIQACQAKQNPKQQIPELPDSTTLREYTPQDAVEMTKVCQQVFISYPFPISARI